MLSHFLAKHVYSNGDENQKVSQPAVRIAILGMAIGLAVMIVSVSVVLGFKHTIRDKVIGFGSHIVVSNFSGIQSGEDIRPVCVNDSMTKCLMNAPSVSHVQRYSLKQGILKTEDDFLGVVIKGVGEEWDSTFISHSLTEGHIPHFSSGKPSNELIMSRNMADNLNVKVGDRIYAYFLSSDNVRMRRFEVCGIYQTNLTKYDESICFTDIHTVTKLNGWNDDQANGYELALSDFDDLMPTSKWMIRNINKTHDRYGETYTTQTVTETNPQLFSWLNLLDLNIWVILALMVCIAVVTMISGLLIIILERVPMIGILKSLGARNSTIRHTFLWLAMFIIGKGILFGNIIGIGICLVQKYTGIIRLDPQTYYVSEAPVEIDIPIILFLNLATAIISVTAMILPSLLVSHINPTKSIKFGG